MKKLLLTLVLLSFVNGLTFSLTEREIENTLKNYQEKGYKFEKNLDVASWEVSFGTDSWKEFVYIYVSPNKSAPDFNIVYIYGNLKTYESDDELSKSFPEIVSAMEVNSSSGEWGFFSLYKEKGIWYLDYNIKLRQKYLDQVQLMNAIGWVAASVNKYKKELQH